MNEHQHQSAFFKWMRLNHPNVLAFAIPNAAKRGYKLAAMMKAEGLISGVPDLMIADGNPGLFIEMKKEKGKVQDSQWEILTRLTEAGYETAVCFGWEHAVEVTQQYLNKGNKNARN